VTRYIDYTVLGKAKPEPPPLQERYAASVVAVAYSQAGVKEEGRNRGPAVEQYLRSVGLGPGYPWCAAFVYWCHSHAARNVGATTKCPRTAAACMFWIAGRKAALECWRPNTMEPQPGDIYIRARRGQDPTPIVKGHRRKGHTGIVVKVDDTGQVWTIDGNTNAAGSAEGDEVSSEPRLLDLTMKELVGFVRPRAVEL
jgi:hypothetical protein